ncbi:MAG TPA: TraR/DksA C4-type zinc finger protein [Gammaproteobacteria bacterium]|nr:TraR/DksA C4-type zinc finger protein [Gammaproteobacteria bacterium]
MADEADLANEQLHSELSRTINRIRKSATAGGGSPSCNDCGEEIPEARRELGFRFCIGCAETRERKQSLFAND